MLRRLLACLALLTGLAAASAPAQAHGAEAEIARVEAGLSQAIVDSTETSVAGHLTDRRIAYASVPSAGLMAPNAWLWPRVLMGIDRARE